MRNLMSIALLGSTFGRGARMADGIPVAVSDLLILIQRGKGGGLSGALGGPGGQSAFRQ